MTLSTDDYTLKLAQYWLAFGYPAQAHDVLKNACLAKGIALDELTWTKNYVDVLNKNPIVSGVVETSIGDDVREVLLMSSDNHEAEDAAPLLAIFTERTAQLISRARALAAYALNATHGAELAPFELQHVLDLAKELGVEVTDKHRAFSLTRNVLGEVMTERRAQVEVHGFTPEDDLVHPERLREAVLDRVSGMPTPEARQQLVQAAAIVVAEIERIDRINAASTSAPAASGSETGRKSQTGNGDHVY